MLELHISPTYDAAFARARAERAAFVRGLFRWRPARRAAASGLRHA